MKYVVTNSSVTIYLDGQIIICDKSHENFKEIQRAARQKNHREILHFVNGKLAQTAKSLLK